ncbi:hypothetical protein GCM10009527_070870 [Actinomadura nitritigenes]|uniref:DUF4352 domain-containing protein n=1 Tax=Actinomadura nitritigenes TaxID=134602 RepID=A0ABS3RB22_9ACTN|nr:hypothetical protein [Actinomadura nitritigenes]MBO2442808.1 hypothetical protein [Actinomadura nitritigenes]
MHNVNLPPGTGGAGQGGTRLRLGLLAGAAVLVTAAAGLGAAALASSGGDGARSASHAFALPAEGENDAVHARMTMTIGEPARRTGCGRMRTATVYPITLTVRNDDPTGWTEDSGRSTTPGLELGLGRADGGQDPSATPEDPFVVADYGCRAFEDVSDKIMEIPARRSATVHLELQASAAPAHDQVVLAALRADALTNGLATTKAAWAIRLDGAPFPLPSPS